MNVTARVATVIDAGGAKAGADATANAAAKTEQAMKKVEKAGENLKNSLKRSGDEAAKAGDKGVGAMDRMAAAAGKVIAALAAVYAAFKTVQAGVGMIMSAIDAASQMEGFRTRWAYMLNSFDAAKVKMKELQTFANQTPFDLPGVTEAALALHRLKNTGLEGMEGLKLVGDSAALAQQKIEEVASRVTRLIGNLQRGAGGGDEARALGEWGVFSPQLVGRIADMGTKASNFKTLLADIKAELGKTDGAMGLMATTWSGLTSTMEDGWNTLKTTVGEPIMTALKPLIADLTTLLDEMNTEAGKLAPTIKDVVSNIPAAFRVMRQDGGFKLMLTAAWDAFADLMKRTWDATGRYLAQVFAKVAYDFKEAVSDPAFWKNIGDTLVKAITDAITAATPMMSNLWATLGAAFGSNKAEDRQIQIEIDRLKATGDIKARVIEERNRRGADGGAFGPSDVKDIYKPDLPKDPAAGTGDGTFGSDLPSNPNPYGPTMFDQPPPEPKWTLDAQNVSDAMGKWSDALDKQRAGVAADVAKAETERDALLRQREVDQIAGQQGMTSTDLQWKMIQDEARFGSNKWSAFASPDTSLFPSGQKPMPDDGTGPDAKPAILEATDKNWKDSQSLAAGMTEKNRTPEEILAEETKLANDLASLNLLTEEQKRREIARTADDFKKAQEDMAEKAKQAAEKQMTPVQKLMDKWGDLAKNIQAAGASILEAVSGNITEAIVSMVDGTKSASQAFADMAKGIVNSILQIITKLLVQYALYMAMGMATGGLSMSFASFGQAALSSGKMHDGGVVGESGGSTRVAASAFSGAARYHTGGVAGLAANEVPTILEKGETVLTRDDASKIRDGLKGKESAPQQQPVNVVIANYFDPTQVDERVASNPNLILNSISANQQKVRRIINGA